MKTPTHEKYMTSGHKTSGPWADISLSALCDNYRMIDAATPAAHMAGVVKCNAYGIGMVQAAAALTDATDCDTFFVAYPEEGAVLRDALKRFGGQPSIYVFNGPLPETLGLFNEASLIPVINTLAQARDWAKAYPGSPCALHVDTGMNRLGAPATTMPEIAGINGLNVETFMSHLACGATPSHEKNEQQRALFDKLSKTFPDARKSLAASAGALMAAGFHYDLVRPGIALYGGTPFDKDDTRIKPVVSLKAPVIQVRSLTKDETVGYNATFTASKSTRIAVIAIGYGDGLPVSASNAASMAINGEIAPIAGRVSMDLTCLDVSDCLQTVKVGDSVEVFGDKISIFEASAACGTHPYELLTGLGDRVDRRYV